MTDEHLQRVLIQGFKPAIRMQIMSSGDCDTISKMLSVARGCEAAQSGDRPSPSDNSDKVTTLLMQMMAKFTKSDEEHKRQILAGLQHPAVIQPPTIMAPVTYAPQPHVQQPYGQHQPSYQQPLPYQPPQQQYYSNNQQQPAFQQEPPMPQRSYPNSNYHGNNFRKDYVHPNKAGQMAEQQRTAQEWQTTRTQGQQQPTGVNTSTTPSSYHTQTQGTTTHQTGNQRCNFCNTKHAKGFRNCPAYGATCAYCGLANHVDSCCYRRQNGQPPLSNP
jgi:hypothetical protein